MNGMSNEQAHLFVQMMTTGYCCGLTHVFECFVNELRSMMNIYAYSEIPERETELYEMMIVYLKLTDPEYYVDLSRVELDRIISNWYASRNPDHPMATRET
jgi:hypothetical protein